MPSVIRLHSICVSVLLLACARPSRDLAVTPGTSSSARTSATSGMAGDYRLTGLLQGTRVSATMRVDSSGRVSYVGGSPVGAHLCEPPTQDTGRLLIRCGTVQIRLAVSDDRFAPTARIAFDMPKPARVEYNPFTCTPIPPDQACALLRQMRTVQVRRVAGQVTLERISD